MLANQGLCLAHVHRGSDSAEPEGHASRPHFHVDPHHGTTHEQQQSGHSHDVPPVESGAQDDSLPSMSPVGEHDSGTVYDTEASIGIRDPNSAGVESAKCATLMAFHQLSDHSDRRLGSGSVRDQPASVFDADCPIYLRTLSLRI